MANVLANTPHIGTILHAVFCELGSIEDWSLLWIIFPVALLWVAVKQKRTLSIQLLAIVSLPLAFYSGIYLLSALQPFQDHIVYTIGRLLSGLSLVALLTLGFAVSAILE